MESLHLPKDLYWDIKMEPDSPPGEFISIINPEDAWILEDNFAEDILLPSEENLKNYKISSSLSPVNDDELLYEFEIDLDLKTEQWIDGKTNVQQLVDYSENLIPLQENPVQAVKVQTPLEIFMELEKICDVANLTQLTPPQTPPQENNDVKQIFEMIAEQSLSPSSDSQLYNGNNNNNNNGNIIPEMSPSSNSDYSSDTSVIDPPMSPDIAREMQIVDEILRSRAKELPDDWTDDEDNESQHSLSSSLSSSYGSELSESILSTTSSLNGEKDDDWSPENNFKLKQKSSGKISNDKSHKKHTRPYGRPVEDKQIRKKEQNKNAATRYRQKKKQEMEEILEEERQLAVRNEELTKQCNDIEREVKYLKQLIKEFHKSKKSNN